MASPGRGEALVDLRGTASEYEMTGDLSDEKPPRLTPPGPNLLKDKDHMVCKYFIAASDYWAM